MVCDSSEDKALSSGSVVMSQDQLWHFFGFRAETFTNCREEIFGSPDRSEKMLQMTRSENAAWNVRGRGSMWPVPSAKWTEAGRGVFCSSHWLPSNVLVLRTTFSGVPLRLGEWERRWTVTQRVQNTCVDLLWSLATLSLSSAPICGLQPNFGACYFGSSFPSISGKCRNMMSRFCFSGLHHKFSL